MATKHSLFNKKQASKSVEEWLKEYDDLLRRNRGGGTLVGYDTSSYRPVYIPGKVSDPTGLGQTGQQVSQGVKRNTPTEDQQLLDMLMSLDTDNMSQDELNNLEMAIDAFAGHITPSKVRSTPASTPTQQPSPIDQFITQEQQSITRPPSSSMTSNNAQLGPLPRSQSAQTPQYEEGTVGANLMKYAGLTDRDISSISDPLLRDYARSQRELALNLLESEQPVEQKPDYRQDTAQRLAPQLAGMVDSGDLKGLELPTIKGVETPKANPIRQALGNTVDWLGGKLGIPETGISEKIAGGPTTNTGRVYAADNYSTSELPDREYKAGEGIQALKDQFSYASKNAFERPQINKIAGQSRIVGDVGGLGETALAVSNRPQSDISDPFFKSGAVAAYKDQLTSGDVDMARNQYGGALNLGLFKDTFYHDPNNIANVFGNTSMAKAATDKYRSYQQSLYPPMSYTDVGYDGISDPNYRRQIDEYNAANRAKVDAYNRSISQYLSSIPEVLRSGNSYSFASPSQRPMYDKPYSKGQTYDSAPYIQGTANFQQGFSQSQPVFSARPTYAPSQSPSSYIPPQQSANIPLSNVGVGSVPPSSSTSTARPIPTPVPTPTQYIPPSQPVQIPLGTYGVGSVSPAPSPVPSQESTFASILNKIRDLFRKS